MSVDLAAPLFFAEFIDFTGNEVGDEVHEYAQVRMCAKRHPGEFIDHFFKSYTYVSNGAHIDMKQDAIVRIHFVETFEKLRSINPKHHLLPENRS